MKQQNINRSKPEKRTIVVDERKKVTNLTDTNIQTANKPVRTLNFVEVGDMDQKRVQLMVQELAKKHDTARGGIHYFLAVRNGKLMTDMAFEHEILAFVNKICEVQNGEIALKGGAADVEVIRRKIE